LETLRFVWSHDYTFQVDVTDYRSLKMPLARREDGITAVAYLAAENDRAGGGGRHEYVDGQVYAMVGASRAHNRVALNMSSLLHERLRGSGGGTFLLPGCAGYLRRGRRG
jgi:hypothetical protein